MITVQGKKIKLVRRNAQGRFPLHYSHFLNRPTNVSDQVYVTLFLSEIATLTSKLNLYLNLPHSETFLSNLQASLVVHADLPEDQPRAIRMKFGELKQFIDAAISLLSGYVSSIYEFIYPSKKEEFAKGSIPQQNQTTSNKEYIDDDDGLPFFTMFETSTNEETASTLADVAPGGKSTCPKTVSKEEKACPASVPSPAAPESVPTNNVIDLNEKVN